jgi:hypothetical protein
MCPKFMAPEEGRGGGGGGPVTAEKPPLSDAARTFLDENASRLTERLTTRMRTEPFLMVVKDVVDETETAYSNLSATGAVTDKLSRADIEAELLGRAAEKVNDAVGEAMTMRIGRAFTRLYKRLKATGAVDAERFDLIMRHLSDGHGNVDALIKSKEVGLANDEIRMILDVREGGLTSLEKDMIDFASKSEIVHKFFRAPKAWPEKTGAKIWRAAGWTLDKVAFPEVKNLVVTNVNRFATTRGAFDRLAGDRLAEGFGAWLDRHPDINRHMKYARYRATVPALAVGIYLLVDAFSEEKPTAGTLPTKVADKEVAKNKDVQAILWASNDYYLKKNSAEITNLIVGTSIEGEGGKPRALTQDEMNRVAKMLGAYRASTVVSEEKKNAFLEKGNKEAIIEVLAVLQQLKLRGGDAEIGELAVDIARWVDPSQRVEFAWAVVNSKEAKEGDIRALLENPPRGFKMTNEWLGRPFEVFEQFQYEKNRQEFKGFVPNENLKRLCAAIRQWNRSAKEGEQQLTEDDMYKLADAFANVYGLIAEKGGAVPEVPSEWTGHLKFMKELMAKGFDTGKAGTILYAIEYTYLEKYSKLEALGGQVFDPLQDDKHRSMLMERIDALDPKMPREELYYAAQSIAYEREGMATREFVTEVNPDIAASFGERIAFMLAMDARLGFSKDARTQAGYRKAGALLDQVVATWKSQRPKFNEEELVTLGPYIVTAALSEPMDRHFSYAEKADILYGLFVGTKDEETVKLQVWLPKTQEAKRVSPTTLPLDVDLAPPEKAAKTGKEETKLWANVRALTLRHIEAYAAGKDAVTVEEMQNEMKTYVDFLRANYSGKKGYTSLDKIEAAFDKHKAKLEKEAAKEETDAGVR